MKEKRSEKRETTDPIMCKVFFVFAFATQVSAWRHVRLDDKHYSMELASSRPATRNNICVTMWAVRERRKGRERDRVREAEKETKQQEEQEEQEEQGERERVRG